MNILTKLVAVILLSLPFIVVGGTLYRRASGAGWRESLFKSYVVLSNVPGQQLPHNFAFYAYPSLQAFHSLWWEGLCTEDLRLWVAGIPVQKLRCAFKCARSALRNWTAASINHANLAFLDLHP